MAEQLARAARRRRAASSRAPRSRVPGFLNVWLARDALAGPAARDPARRRRASAAVAAGAGERVQVEFVSANPTGPLTLGHGRQAVLGDCIARAARGARLRRHARVLLQRRRAPDARARRVGEGPLPRAARPRGAAARRRARPTPTLPGPPTIDGLPVVFPSDGYQGDYIGEIAARSRARARRRRSSTSPATAVFREVAQAAIFERDRGDARRARRSRFDVYSNETTLYETGKLDERARRPAQAGSRLRGRRRGLAARDGARARARPRAGEVDAASRPTCCPTSPITATSSARGFDRVIDVQGADHIEQFPFVRAAVGALGCDAERIELVMHQFVTLTRGGEQVKQSHAPRDLRHRRRAARRGRRRRVPLLHGRSARPTGTSTSTSISPRTRTGRRTRPTTCSTRTRARTASSARRAEQGIACPTRASVDAARAGAARRDRAR